MHVHNQDRLASIPRLGEGVKVSKIEAGVPMGKAIVRTGVMVRHKLSPPLFWIFVCYVYFSVNFTSSEQREIVPCRSSCARKPRPPFRAGMFQPWGAHPKVPRSSMCPLHRLMFPMPILEYLRFE